MQAPKPRYNTRRPARRPALRLLRFLCVTLAAGTLLFGCRNLGCERRPDVEGHRRGQTLGNMQMACKFVMMAEAGSGERAPLAMDALVQWFSKHKLLQEQEYDLFIDPATNRMIDGWRRPLVALEKDGRLTGFGSAGTNGRWEGGGGDDITIDLEKVRRREWPLNVPETR